MMIVDVVARQDQVRAGAEETHAVVEVDHALGHEPHDAATQVVAVVTGAGGDVLVQVDIGLGRGVGGVDIQTAVVDRVDRRR